jgi:plastocyanin
MVSLLAAAGLVAALLAPVLAARVATAQTTPQTWEVQVGLSEMGPTGSFEAQAFGPDPLIIRAGDTVTWKFASVHTVTFNSGKPDLPLAVPGTNAGELMVGPAFFPMGPQGPGATYDGTQQVSSGAPLQGPPDQFSYSLTFTKTGQFAYVCAIHPGMRGQIEVREAGAPLPETPAQARTRGQVTLNALVGKIKQDAQASGRGASAAGVSTVLAGLGNGFGASAVHFLPDTVTVRRGDIVVWTLADPFEDHTVTFTSGATPPDLIEPRPQPSGPPQIFFNARAVTPAGGDTYTGTGYVNSGLLNLTPGRTFVLRVDAPPGTYDYLCLIHPFQKGRIIVTP